MWVIGHAMNCCISPFADSICLKIKEYENKLIEAEDIMSTYEEEIEVLKTQLKELSEQYDDCRKLKRSRID
jgi:phage shock protein A